MSMTHAEVLLYLARSVLLPRDRLIECDEPLGGEAFARIRLALDLAAAPAGLRFRAVVEEWDAVRINQELY